MDEVREPALGRVIAAHRGRWLVHTDDGRRLLLPARRRLRGDGVPVVGDRVRLQDDAVIKEVLPRSGVIVRRRAGRETGGQVLAANVDVALAVEPLPEPNLRRLERFAALAAAGGVPVRVVLTKADRDPDGGAAASAMVAARLPGSAVTVVAALDGVGVGEVAAAIAPDRSAVVLGPSGAGKSTLVNALVGADRQRTATVRATDDRGRHTTVGRELIELPGGGWVIDTPGIREVGIWDEGVDEAFADISGLAAECRFADCAHRTEPGCAVRDAVSEERLASWRTLQREEAWIDDRRAASRERERRGRAIARAQRADPGRGRR